MAAGDQVSRPGHIQYGDLLLGPGTPYGWRAVSGWEDLPALDSGSVARSDAHGAIPGPLLAQARTVSLDGLLVRAPRATVGAVVAALHARTVPVTDELPLVVWLDDRGPLLAHARVTRRALPAGPGWTLGTIAGGAVEWEASDPRRYELAARSVSARLPVPEPGLVWPLVWPLDFGPPGSTGSMTAVNAGDAPAHPVIEVRGPVIAPSLTCIESGDTLEYDLPLASDDVLTVDTAAGTVTLNGASRIHTASGRSVPEQTFTLAPGTTNLIFRAAPGSTDPAASATVRWRSAYW